MSSKGSDLNQNMAATVSSQRYWGPFTGNHLTIIFVAAMAVFLPGTLWAVDAFTNVAIEDPLTGTKASVNSARRMGVFGSVTATETVPANFYRAPTASTAGSWRS